MMLPQVMDLVMDLGGNFNIEELRVGQHKDDISHCRMEVVAADPETLDRIVRRAKELGAVAAEESPVQLMPIEQQGVYPEGFYSTTNLPTYVLVGGTWLPVQKQEMDCAIAVDEAAGSARCIPFYEATPGLPVVVGHGGVRLVPLERSRQTETFTFMASEVSAEKPKKQLISKIAGEMRQVHAEGGRILVVSWPAVVHTGAGRYLSQLIEMGYVQVLFAGNALAVHDVEAALFGTALGVNLESGLPIEHGHEHHMRAINRVRAAGSLKAMVESAPLKRGVRHTASTHEVDIVVAGSVRADGPFRPAMTDLAAAQT